MSSNLVGFYHLCQRGEWRNIFAEYVAQCRASGLAEALSNVYVTVLGNEPLELEPPFREIYRSANLAEMEFPALAFMHAYSCLHPDTTIFYAHSKGVLHPGDKHTRDWREYMVWGCIERWRDCVAQLREGADMAGVEWHEGGWPVGSKKPKVQVKTGFWAGNFWWARAEYLKRLPSPTMLDIRNRWECEAWIGRVDNIRPGEIHHLGVREHPNGTGGIFHRDFSRRNYADARGAPVAVSTQPAGRGFYLVCQRGDHWRDIVAEQVKRARRCGVLDALDKVEVIVLGDEPLELGKPFEEVYQSPDLSEYEWPAIERMSEYARANPESMALYFHTKGVSHPGDPYREWRRYLNWGVLDRWRDCVWRLREGWDTCGVDWLFMPHLTPRDGQPGNDPVNYHTGCVGCWPGSHFWATCKHLARLPGPGAMDRGNRWACEAWIGMHPDTRWHEIYRAAPGNAGYFAPDFGPEWYSGPKARTSAAPAPKPRWVPAEPRDHCPQESPTGRRIVGFMHIACLTGWKAIRDELLDMAAGSGLLDHTERVKTSYVLKKGSRGIDLRACEEIVFDTSKRQWEMVTLEKMRLFAIENPGVDIWYCHLKGLLGRGIYAADWRRCMAYWILERWRDCIRLLADGHDCAGVAWTRGDAANGMDSDWHYSGNFWWARSEYIATLPSLAGSTDRYDAERWIGRRKPKAACLYREGVVWNPHEPHPREMYA